VDEADVAGRRILSRARSEVRTKTFPISLLRTAAICASRCLSLKRNGPLSLAQPRGPNNGDLATCRKNCTDRPMAAWKSVSTLARGGFLRLFRPVVIAQTQFVFRSTGDHAPRQPGGYACDYLSSFMNDRGVGLSHAQIKVASGGLGPGVVNAPRGVTFFF